MAEFIESGAAAVSGVDVVTADEMFELRSELVAARHRAELAEARAEERQRSIEILERQVLMLIPAPPSGEADEPVVLDEPVPAIPALRKRRWWQRRA